MNSPTENPESYWREKYLRLLDDEEVRHAEQGEKEQLLSRAVIRLTFAASGLDPVLDPHLHAIREVMKKELKTATLRQELDALMDTLIRIPTSDHPDHVQSAGQALLRFMRSQFSPQYAENMAAFQEQIESGHFSTEEQIFSTVAKLLKSGQGFAGSDGKKLFGKLLGAGHRNSPEANQQKLRKPLESLLKALNVPASLEKRMAQLLLQVQQGDEDLILLLDSSASLITEISAEIKNEQRALRDFLSGLSSKLGELEEKTFGLDSLHQESAQNRRNTDQSVSSEVASLRAAAVDATDLLQLKEIISTRLEFVSSQMESFRDSEELRFSDSQKQLQEVSQRVRVLEQEADDLRSKLTLAHEFAYTDPLTRLPNRAAYLDRVALEEKRWKRFGHPLSVLIWDIDYFKQINDRFGHAAGDKALSFIGRILVSAVRGTDFVARYGGEEFVMLLAGSDETYALDVAEDIRRRIETCEFTTAGKPVPITISCGISQFKGQDTYEEVFERADQSLYQAKRKGRNRCELAPGNR